jgi:hypothetical protein
MKRLEPLPYSEWEPTLTTLHLYCQIVGKVALRASALRNHWWNVTLRPTSRGLVTTRLHAGGIDFEIAFDLIAHRVVVRTGASDEAFSLALEDGLSVASFYAALTRGLEQLGIRVPILAKPYGMAVTVPFAEDDVHKAYDREYVRRWHEVVVWTSDVLETFASDFAGKQGPVQLFWHSFDLALARYSGRRNPGPPSPNPVEREAYSHEVIAFGFWPGDPVTTEAMYYTYTAPEPAGLAERPLLPSGAQWAAQGASHLGVISYDAIRSASDPEAALRAFCQSGYASGAEAAAWDVAALLRDAAKVRNRA